MIPFFHILLCNATYEALDALDRHKQRRGAEIKIMKKYQAIRIIMNEERESKKII